MSSPPLCPNCGVNPPWPNFKHCGKRCAKEAAAKEAAAKRLPVPPLYQAQPPAPPQPIVQQPTPRRRQASLPPNPQPPGSPGNANNTGGGGHGHRGRQRFNKLPPPAPPVRRETLKPITGNYDPLKGAICKLPGCVVPPYQFGMEYCSMEHREDAVKQGVVIPCILCHKYPKGLYGYCGWNCSDHAQRNATLLLLLDKRDPKFEEIRNRWEASWKARAKVLPQVRYIYKIQMSKPLMDTFFAYRARIEHTRNFTGQRMAPANECPKWYGTRRMCAVGDDPANPVLCGARDCVLCFVLKHSFRRPTAPMRNSRMRFGQGVYTSALSSRADDYSINGGNAAYKAAVLATVIVGKGSKQTRDRPTLSAAPTGYDSVLTETANTMAFDEVVVYDNDAIRPVWLVIYG